jgi:hypothetical protein
MKILLNCAILFLIATPLSSFAADYPELPSESASKKKNK